MMRPKQEMKENREPTLASRRRMLKMYKSASVISIAAIIIIL